MSPKSRSLEECYQVARMEAERYQALINKLPNLLRYQHEREVLTAKRNAASRIARLISHGQDIVREQEQQEVIR